MIQAFGSSAVVEIDPGAPSRGRSVISVTGMAGHVRSLSCSVSLEHQCLADLRLRLIAPDGREVILASRRWGNDPGRLDVVFSDDAVHLAGSRKSGNIKPDWPLKSFAGVRPNGKWTLVVDDVQRGDGGKLLGWDLRVQASEERFNIELEYSDLEPQYRDTFETAKRRWESAIVGDLPTISVAGRTIDDVLIYASGVHIDGPGGILGQAGPNYIRSNGLPITGVMQFDLHDLEEMYTEGSLADVIVHEMGHVLGLGTLWQRLVRGLNTDDPVFVGENAMREYGSLIKRPPTPVPVENTGGPGTRGGHWRESVFDHELMTGWLDRGTNPLSRMTLGALADLGYAVNFDAADEYQFLTGFRRPQVGKRRNCCVSRPTEVVVV